MPDSVRIIPHKQTRKKHYLNWRRNTKYLSKERDNDIYSFAIIKNKNTNSNDKETDT